ncbi:MAG: DNA translocase FtsK [Patescibacteria group bacterium]
MSKNNRAKKNGSKPKRREPSAPKINPLAKKELAALFLFVVSVICLLSFFDLAGAAGRGIDSFFAALFGIDKFLIPFVVLGLAGRIVFPEKFSFRLPTWLGLFLFVTGWGGLLDVIMFRTVDAILIVDNVSRAGGFAGLLLAYPLLAVAGFWAALIILVMTVIIALVLTFNVSLHELSAKLAGVRHLSWPWPFGHRIPADPGAPAIEPAGEFKKRQLNQSETDGETAVTTPREAKYAEPPVKLRKKYPPVAVPTDLLENRFEKPTAGDINGRLNVIKKTLENFGIPVEMGEFSVGPTVTQFTLKPAEGIKLTRITSLSNDLALSLAAHPIRIEAPIPGKSLVGIEVPNQTVAVVGLREVLESNAFQTRRTNLTVCLGKDVSGKPWVADLGKMPHLLVAGATGSGKTVCLNSVILSLLYQNSPDDLRLILIDPKRVEMPVYNGVPHLLTPAITEVPKIINALKWCIREMDRRFELLSQKGCRDIGAYNSRVDEKMPYIVVLIDELADLMVASASEVEASIIRLAQMARAVGIHLIVATQRPSVDVITGLIKANITSRIAFSVASVTDSRTILDTAGAEKLVGRGDSLFQTPELSKPKRIQCCYVSDSDTRRVVDFLISKLEEPADYDDTVTAKPGHGGPNGNGGMDFGYNNDGDDELLDEAKETVVKAGKASASYLQRRLKIGYARAARLLDLLEERGIIGPGDGAKPRQVLVTPINDVDGVHVIDPEDKEETSAEADEDDQSEQS